MEKLSRWSCPVDIELFSLDLYGILTEIDSIDVSTNRVDRFGEYNFYPLLISCGRNRDTAKT